MESLKFWKYQSVGNDFVILHEDCWNSLGKLGLDATRIIPLICDRKTGLGADGVLVVSQLNGEVHLKMFNADGTEDFCGNGIRCCARQAYDLGWVGEDFGITHFGRRVRCQVDKNHISTDLGFATYDHRLIPTNAEGELFLADLPMPTGERLQISTLSTGTAHTIIHVPELPTDDLFFAASPVIEHHPLFPERTSVIWCEVLSDHHLRLRIWERGVGETLGCGTGSAAAAADWMRRNGSGGRIDITSKGGKLTVSADQWDCPLTISGVAEEVFSGHLHADLIQKAKNLGPVAAVVDGGTSRLLV